jgi:hypothetical protein
MSSYRKPKYTARLSGVAVTPEMASQIHVFARHFGIGVSDLQRRALALFLRINDSSSVIIDSETVSEINIRPEGGDVSLAP